ncbi:response regulator receiver protein [Stanieria cyanosphaera PCC 7437]|uniref:Response regulator receiver protein n=1 Tax=Stanieria cyanosphaera (strain ATCC 29371 / PCC 7437) TaxID=111780 RepID=K9XRH7_STAC7|nr:response regulator [Stanieria cyanosphaera]AFZ35220.1 response regulator receiver protein [Stanieria cyanosphaera PCC 7437]
MTKRILIVDDEEDIRDVVQVSLEEFGGWLAIAAASGSEGLQIAKTEALDAILLDVSMPDLDGFQLCEELKIDPTTQNIPVILLTAKVLPSDRQRFAALEVAGVIAKPFDPITVWQQVAEILDWNG